MIERSRVRVPAQAEGEFCSAGSNASVLMYAFTVLVLFFIVMLILMYAFIVLVLVLF